MQIEINRNQSCRIEIIQYQSHNNTIEINHNNIINTIENEAEINHIINTIDIEEDKLNKYFFYI